MTQCILQYQFLALVWIINTKPRSTCIAKYEGDKSRRMRWTVNVAGMGETGNAYTILVGKREGERSFRRPRLRWEDNIRMDLR
jgi:hypothetical protein